MKHAHRESFMAGIVVQYGRDAPERYEAHLSITPLGETCVLLRRPFADDLAVAHEDRSNRRIGAYAAQCAGG